MEDNSTNKKGTVAKRITQVHEVNKYACRDCSASE